MSNMFPFPENEDSDTESIDVGEESARPTRVRAAWPALLALLALVLAAALVIFLLIPQLQGMKPPSEAEILRAQFDDLHLESKLSFRSEDSSHLNWRPLDDSPRHSLTRTYSSSVSTEATGQLVLKQLRTAGMPGNIAPFEQGLRVKTTKDLTGKYRSVYVQINPDTPTSVTVTLSHYDG